LAAETYYQRPAALDQAALHGLAGEYVRALAPQSEADPVALLVQFLTIYGISIGRHSYCVAAADRHYGALFVAGVGETGRARKGTSLGLVKTCFARVEPGGAAFIEEHIRSGISSGEGIVHLVRDIPPADPTTEILVRDKRLVFLQPELAALFAMMMRQGNTVSARLREAWDGQRLDNDNKNSAEHSTGHHIGLVAHITRDELLRLLPATESSNGFANRILWYLVTRSKYLPEGGDLSQVDFAQLTPKLKAAIDFGKKERLVTRDAAAKQLWADEYRRLSDGQPGLLGAITARAEAITMRLSLLYALLDRSDTIRIEHLRAALAVWRYAEESARYIFGDALGDPTADELLSGLRRYPEGLTRAQISEALFSKNTKSTEISRALGVLLKADLIWVEQLKTNGRPAERYHARRPGAGGMSQ